MDSADLQRVLVELRRLGGEPTGVEAKASAGGVPGSAVSTVSAFANTNGGVLLLGVDERHGFSVVGLDNPAKLRDDLVSQLSDKLEPAIRPAVELVEVEAGVVVVAEIAPLTSDRKPCYVRSRGIADGSYVRTGDGDRRMTQAEIGLTIANRGQPVYDAEPVAGARPDDLDRIAVLRMLERARASSRSLRDVEDEVALRRLRVLTPGEAGQPVPTLGGLLALGVYPQEYFPQLMVTVVVHPGPDDDRRFLDNRQLRGPIPEQVDETLAVVRRNLAVRGFVDATGRRDTLDYPMEAIREAVVNAVLHRDYSPVSRGTQVTVDLHPDRLVVTSPGGLFGPVTEEDLGQEGVSSSRNSHLAQLLSDTYLPHSDRVVAENRASGIPAMIRDSLRSGSPSPIFRNFPNRFEVAFARSELFDPATREWLREVRDPGYTPLHDLALALLGHGNEITNAQLREFGADPAAVGRVLADLVASGLAEKLGGRRYARYRLAAPETPTGDELFPDLFENSDGVREGVIIELRRSRRIGAADLAERVGRSRPAVLATLRELIDEGLVRADGAPTSPRRSYVWIGDGDE